MVIVALGRFFSGALEVQKGQTLVKTGPYRYVCHLSYTGASHLSNIGASAAVMGSWGAVLALALIFAVVYSYRMHVEEKV